MSGGRLLEASGDRRRRLMVEAPSVGVQNPAYTVCAEISVPAAGRDPCGRNFLCADGSGRAAGISIETF